MLKLSDVEYNIGERSIFSNIDLNINPYDRFGLVGANGSGKTTLLRIIAGELSPSQGHAAIQKGVNIGYLPQEEIVLHGNTLLDEILKDYKSRSNDLSRLRDRISKNPHSKELMRAYGIAEENFHKIGGYDYEPAAYRIIAGLGFIEDDHRKLVQEFSSGWQMRIVLARLLLNRPDILLLDEPTNHLDIESIQWLENYLQGFKGAMIIVSHDRYFLDKILQSTKGVTGILEIDFGTFRRYRGNYSSYIQESKLRKEKLLHLAKAQEKKISEIKEFITRNKANKSKARIVKSREKYLERLERVQIEKERKKIKVKFPVEKVHSARLINLDDIYKDYNGKKVFSNINLSIENGDKIALIGKNGAGKSSLCRIIAGHEVPTSGTRKASEKLKIGAFSHEILSELDPGKAVIEEVTRNVNDDTRSNIRKFLGLFLFSGDDVFKRIEVLSGGEKTRLVILKVMLEPSNLLILDEPTYHLDRDSTEAIKQAINSYDGTIILVTHDRDLIASFATRIVELKDGRLYDYPGDFSYYRWKRRQSDSNKQKKSKEEQSLVRRLQQQIMQKESRRRRLRDVFTRPTVVNNPRKARKLFEEYQRLSEEIEALEAKLSTASE